MKRTRAKGGGRKPAPYKTKVLSVRVRVEWYDDLKKLITKFLNSKK